MTAKLPDLDQLKMKDYEFVYEPSDDTFLLCDALENDRSEIIQSRPKLVVEIGWVEEVTLPLSLSLSTDVAHIINRAISV